jgi:hypothetical protein
MGSEHEKLGRWRNLKQCEQYQEWWGTRPKRKQDAGAMGVNGKVRNSPFPSPVISRSRGATPPKTSRVAPIKCRWYPTPQTSGPSRVETAAHAHMRDHYSAVTEWPRCPITSAPTSPATSAKHRLKRRAHYARPRP